ncbi:MAG: glycosyltransferase [Candidatus Saccharimonadales bacterium]
MAKLKILILCHDVIGEKMAGPGIRYQNIAKVLENDFSVTLGVFSKHGADNHENITAINPDSNDYREHFDDADVVFAQWLSDSMLDYAKARGVIVIFDLYAPVPVEYLANLAFAKSEPSPLQISNYESVIEMYRRYLSTGQLFVCSNERQRDFWTGYTAAMNLLDVGTFKKKSRQDNFIIGPMGIDPNIPKSSKLMLRKKLGLKKSDFVLLWTGGIWDWFDAQIIIRAMSKLSDNSIKLVFLGTKHPNPIYKEEMNESTLARKLASELGLTDKTVFFLDGWIPYEERGNYLLDADVAIYSDKESPETRLAHRTRVLDHFWSLLPTICPRGDFLSEKIEQKELGIVVDERSEEAFVQAIIKLHSDTAFYTKIVNNIKQERQHFTWESTLSQLVDHLKTMNVPSLRKQIIKDSVASPRNTLPLLQRIKRAARIILLGR